MDRFRTGPGPPGQVQDLQEHLQDVQEQLQDHVQDDLKQSRQGLRLKLKKSDFFKKQCFGHFWV